MAEKEAGAGEDREEVEEVEMGEEEGDSGREGG